MESGRSEGHELLDEVSQLAEAVDVELARLLELYEAHHVLRAPDLELSGGRKRSLPALPPGLSESSRSARLVC